MIRLKNVSKFYYSKGVIASGFTKVNLKFSIGEFVAITGESGSGKSTLLNVISGLDTYEEGEMYVNGQETSHYLEKDWEDYRRKNIGNIYQNFNLINSYTVYQNIDLILTLNGVSKKVRKRRVLTLLKRVDMMKYKNTKVSKLSGGQKQRVAIARALAKDVPIIIADEPTGSLDKKSALNVIKLLKEIAKDKLVIIVTHNYEQVEEYVTRKITMHDGKVIEDHKISRDIVEGKYQKSDYKNTTFIDKIILGFRNTFNVLPKFILLFLVYSFIVAALMGEYSFFKKSEYEANRQGLNTIFKDLNDHRIIVNKKNRETFTKEELEAIKGLGNVSYILENDAVVDQEISFSNKNEELWLNGSILPRNELKKVDYGTMPVNPNEIVVMGRSYDFQIDASKDEVINSEFYLSDPFTDEVNKTKTYKIVGIIYNDDVNIFGSEYAFYLSDEVMKSLLFKTHQASSKITTNFMGTNHVSVLGDPNFRVDPNNWVTPGTAIVSEDFNTYCEKENCLKKSFNINVKNMYYEDNKTFIIEKLYNKKNITNILDLPSFNKENFEYTYNGVIYINPIDYNKLFDKGTYQISVYVDDVDLIEDTQKVLEKTGFNTLKIKDTFVSLELSQILRIIKLIVTILLVIALFFISYFIIKLILKSRNNYFAILRMLGASKNVCRHLLIIELFVIANLSYFIFIGIAELNKTKYLNVEFINTVNRYFKFNDYIILYIVIILMSLLISLRFARDLFKNSVMTSYREEV